MNRAVEEAVEMRRDDLRRRLDGMERELGAVDADREGLLGRIHAAEVRLGELAGELAGKPPGEAERESRRNDAARRGLPADPKDAPPTCQVWQHGGHMGYGGRYACRAKDAPFPWVSQPTRRALEAWLATPAGAARFQESAETPAVFLVVPNDDLHTASRFAVDARGGELALRELVAP